MTNRTHFMQRLGGLCLVTSLCALAAVSQQAVAQTAQEGKNISALAAENLKKPRPKAPVDLTGTYNFDFASNGPPMSAYLFSPSHKPSVKLTPQAEAEFNKWDAYQAKGIEYKDDSAACWPLGMPRTMTRYWPIQIIQLPTMVVLTSMFNNSIRWIYTDGRQHPADEDIVLTYNGHSIGHWEGKTLVVDTVGMTDERHWIQEGVPTGTKLHIVERISLSPDRNKLTDEFTMTDPENWAGEWKSSKIYVRDDHADIEEHVCIYEQVSKLPGFDKNIRE